MEPETCFLTDGAVIAMKIVIDPGHGGWDPGAISESFLEKVLNLQVALHLKKMLTERGFDVKLTRETDAACGAGNSDLAERARIANDYVADLFVSIHHNAFNGHGYGAETFHYPESTEGKKLASAIQNQFVKNGLADRGVKKAEFAVLRRTLMPAILGEYCFIDHEKDQKFIDTDEKLKAEADAYCRGICEYAGVEYNQQVKLMVNGEFVTLEQPIQIIDDRAYVPVRELCEELGYKVSWYPDKKIIFVEG